LAKVNDEALQEALRAIRIGDTVQAFYALLSPLLKPRKPDWRTDTAFHMLAAVLSTPGGTIDGVREAQLAYLEDTQIPDPRVISDRTLNRYLPDFGRIQQRGKDIDYQPWLLEQGSDDTLLTAFTAAMHIAVIRRRSFFIALDGSSRPFYGLSYHYSDRHPERLPGELSVAGRNTSPAFQRDSRMYPGTVNKHEYFQMSLHLYDGKESFPLGIRRGAIDEKGIRDFLRTLDDLPVKPLAVFADRAFSNFVKGDLIRTWCDLNGVLFVTPAVRHSNVENLVTEAWHEGRAKPIKFEGETIHWSCRPHFWRQHMDSKNNLLVLYFRRDPRKDENPAADLQQLPNGLYAVPFVINVEADETNALWIWKQYANRWSIENLFKRYKAYCGTSYGHGLFLRDYTYHASMVLMATYSLWRLYRRQDGAKPRDTSHTRFFGSFRQQVVTALWQGQVKITH
jgi:hypothetical protein